MIVAEIRKDALPAPSPRNRAPCHRTPLPVPHYFLDIEKPSTMIRLIRMWKMDILSASMRTAKLSFIGESKAAKKNARFNASPPSPTTSKYSVLTRFDFRRLIIAAGCDRSLRRRFHYSRRKPPRAPSYLSHFSDEYFHWLCSYDFYFLFISF